jgi:hypothetical protein
VEYKIWDQVGVRLGWESNRIEVEAEDQDALLDSLGKLDWWYSGVWLYTKVFFLIPFICRADSREDVLDRQDPCTCHWPSYFSSNVQG